MKEGRGAILSGGTVYPGFNSVQEAMEAIVHDPKFQRPGAVAIEFGDQPPKRTFREDFPFMDRRRKEKGAAS